MAQASSDESFVHSQNLKHLPILPQSTLHTLTPQKDDAAKLSIDRMLSAARALGGEASEATMTDDNS